ncbi:hypothetical protein GPX89_22905 [Nocardia sp. ET3-3]|uniref:Uncharacterized protein n=1 Tax=Nocardia terrae TaxID=2675851 RepID=A0A7K1V0G6_9NOCA|nr:hypothetical protein [Nocardia terrae]MVU80084.1 hypothetical protein [Nocardia terrae]
MLIPEPRPDPPPRAPRAADELALDLPPVTRVGDSTGNRPGPESVEATGDSNDSAPESPPRLSPDSGDDPPAQRPEKLPEAVEAVVMRWNPHGLALLRAVAHPGTDGAAAIGILGEDETHAAALRVEVAKFHPRIDFIVPVDEREHARPVAVALVVLDAGALIGEEMVARVRGLWTDGARVVFALDGVHAHRDWRDVLKLDAEMLEQAGGGGVEIVPVSARMAAVARAQGDPALLDRAGVGLLHARLVDAVGAGAVRDQVGIVRERVVGETRRRIEAQLGKLRAGRDVAVLREERARLLAVNDGGRGSAMAVVRNRVQLARVDLLHEVGGRIRASHTELRGEIEGLARGAHAEFVRHVSDCVEKLTQEMDRTIRSRVGELCRQVEESVAEEWHISFPAAPEQVSRAVAAPGPRLRGVEDHLVVALGASAGFGLGRLAMTPLALLRTFDYAIMPVGLLLGAAVASWFVRARRHLADAAHLRQWVADTLVDARAELEQRVATALVDVEERLTDEVLGSATAHMVETDLRVGELEAQLRQAAQRRPALLLACERDLAALEFA